MRSLGLFGPDLASTTAGTRRHRLMAWAAAGFGVQLPATATPARWSAGPWPPICAPSWPSTRCRWPCNNASRRGAHLSQRPWQPAQYTAGVYTQALEVAGARQSMGRVATYFDNAAYESLFATLKTELVHTRTWPTRQAARTAIYEYLEVFYNRWRRHSALGYLSPAEYERRYHHQQPGTLVAA
jgi:putative transposase